MYVAQIITTLARGGAQATVLASLGLDEREPSPGPTITVLAGPDDPGEGTHWAELAASDLGATGVRLIEVPSLRRRLAPLDDLRAAVWLWRWLRANRPDVAHTHSSKAGVLGRLAAMAAGVPVVHTVHGWSFAPSSPGGGHSARIAPRAAIARLARAATIGVERLLARRSAALVVVTPIDAETGLANGIGRPEQYQVVRSGIDLAGPRRGRAERGRIRSEYGFDGRFVVGTVGRLAAQKDLATLIRGFAKADVADGLLVIVGDGPDRADLETLAAELLDRDRYRFLGARPDAARLVAAFDAFGLTSRWEGLPRTLIEAVAAGVPVVTTPVGGIREIIVHRSTGTLVDVGDEAAVAAALVDLVDGPDDAQRQAVRAAEGIERFSAETMRSDLIALWAGASRT